MKFLNFLLETRLVLVSMLLASVMAAGVVNAAGNGIDMAGYLQSAGTAFASVGFFALVFAIYRGGRAKQDGLWSGIAAVGAIALFFGVMQWQILPWVPQTLVMLSLAYLLSVALTDSVSDSRRVGMRAAMLAMLGGSAFAIALIRLKPDQVEVLLFLIPASAFVLWQATTKIEAELHVPPAQPLNRAVTA